MPENKIGKNRYENLRKALEQIILEGRRELEAAARTIAVETHWNVGKRLSESLDGQSSKRATETIARLADDLKMHKTVLYRSQKFFKAYPEGLPETPAFKSLSWGAHTELLPLGDPRARQYYMERGARERWSRERLRSAIRADVFSRSREGGGDPKAALARPDAGPYVYEAVVDRVVDGDTLIARIDLGFDVWKSQRVRLRGVEAPASDTPKGKKTTRFVEKEMQKARCAAVRTYKLDKYGRYVADVFYSVDEMDARELVEGGAFLNEALVKKGLAELV